MRGLAPTLVLGSLIVFLVLAGTACERREHPRSAGGEPRPVAGRVLLVGIDGLEWNVVLDMLEAGRMPALASILEHGAYGQLEVDKPTLSPILWTSIATGVRPVRHGIRGFLRAGKEPQAERLHTSTDRRAKALWNIATEAGVPSWIIGWWLTFPVEPITGVMVAQVNTATPQMRRAGEGVWKGALVPGIRGQVHPAELETMVLAHVVAVERELDETLRSVFGDAGSRAGGVVARYFEQSRWAVRADAIYRRVALALYDSRPAAAITAVYFGGADVVGHRFWRYLEPDKYREPPAADEIERFADVIPAYYAYLDGIVAELVGRAPRDTNVVVVSDHGMQAVNRRARYHEETLSGGHLGAPPAFFAAAGPAIRRSEGGRPRTRADVPTLGSIYDVAPTILALVGLPIPEDLDGRVLREVVTAEHLEAHPIRHAGRATPPGWRPRSVDATAAPDSVERIEQLRSLGYLD